MEARRHVEVTGGNGLAALGGGSGCTTWKGDIGHMTWKGGISLATRLGGSDCMTGRGQQHAAPSNARSQASSASCLAGPTAERCTSETARWPTVIAHERLPLGLAYLRAAASSPLCGSIASTPSPALLAGLASSCTSDCRRGSLASTSTRVRLCTDRMPLGRSCLCVATL
jgi:hypothetical protein